MNINSKEAIIIAAANKLLTANNTVTTLEIKNELRKTHSTMWWDQQSISDCMRTASNNASFDFIDNGTFRVYSGTPTRVPANTQAAPVAKRPVGRPRKVGTPTVVPTPVASPAPVTVSPAAPVKKAKAKVVAGLKFTGPAKYLSRTTAKKLMSDNKGHFFTAVFVDKKGNDRLMNCQYLKDQTGADLGYVKVNEASLVREARKAPKNAAGKPIDANGKVITTIRNVNLQTLKAIKIAGECYKIR